jgi:hypothetical protein
MGGCHEPFELDDVKEDNKGMKCDGREGTLEEKGLQRDEM